jgi:hypothetical protein
VAQTNAQLQEENQRLRARVAELEQRNAGTAPGRIPLQPSFGMSEGEREEIERTGSAVSPFDGQRRTENDLPEGVEIDPARRQREAEGPKIDYSAPVGE